MTQHAALKKWQFVQSLREGIDKVSPRGLGATTDHENGHFWGAESLDKF